MEKALERARILIEALPYIREFADRVMVIKLGGHAMQDGSLEQQFAEDMVLLKAVGIHPVVVHGGGPQIAELLKKLGVESCFVQGMRVTDDATLDVVEMVLGGTVNGRIVTRINTAGGRGIGLSGRDANLIVARPLKLANCGNDPEAADLGHVGEVENVDSELLLTLCARRMIPVIAPLGVDAQGQGYNINADLVASAVAASLAAEKLILLTDVAGVLDARGALIPHLDRASADAMIAAGEIKGGMIPKVNSAFAAIGEGVKKVHIIDGRVPHAVILELFTDAGIGTEFVGS